MKEDTLKELTDLAIAYKFAVINDYVPDREYEAIELLPETSLKSKDIEPYRNALSKYSGYSVNEVTSKIIRILIKELV